MERQLERKGSAEEGEEGGGEEGGQLELERFNPSPTRPVPGPKESSAAHILVECTPNM